MLKFSTKKTLNKLLNQKIISKRQSTLLTYKKLNDNHLTSENLLGDKMNFNNKTQYQSKKRFSVFTKNINDVIKE